MVEILAHYIDFIAKIVEVIGVLIMFFGLLYAFYRGVRSTGRFTHDTYVEIRQTVGKSILLGLEVLIALLLTLWLQSLQILRCAVFWYWALLC